jgi:uncharacterized protein
MQLTGSTLLLSATDVTKWLSCAHLPLLDHQVLHGLEEPPRGGSESADLIPRHGFEHERRLLERFQAEGLSVAAVERTEAAVPRTAALMHAGVEVIHQAALAADGWVGYADFLRRVERPSALGAWSYEAWDTKLSHAPKPVHVLQLCLYGDLLGVAQGVAPCHIHLVLGDGAAVSYRFEDFAAYARRLRRRLSQALAGNESNGLASYPYPTSHCPLCEYDSRCEARRRADDHLSLVAGMRRDQIEKLEAVGVRTVPDLGRESAPCADIGSGALARLRHQARLQVEGRAAGRTLHELLPPEPNRGLSLLPAPSPGDVFFDIEGDPFFDRGGGLEYLLGVMDAGAAQPGYRAFWGVDRPGEKRAFEQFIDFLMDRLRRYPDLHVYHYAAYEKTAVRSLMARHGTREEEVDDLLRRERFVDLYQATRQAVRASLESYSLKRVRSLFMKEVPITDVRHGDDSIVAFERWLLTRDQAILDGIEEYNRLDCLSTVLLREWLLERRREAASLFGQEPPFRAVGTKQASDTLQEERNEAAILRERLAERAAADPAAADALALMADLLDYHRREEKPAWWAYYDRLTKDDEGLLNDTEAIAGLEPDANPTRDKKSLAYTCRFPSQELKLREGKVDDPATREYAGELLSVDADAGVLLLKRGPSFEGLPIPRAIVAQGPPQAGVQRKALSRVARSVCDVGMDASPYRASTDLLRRAAPRLSDHPGGAIQTTTLDEQRRLVSGLNASTLVVQGPPGSGKTWLAARLIVDQIRQDRRIGVSALSHKAIHNLLAEVEHVAAAEGLSFRGLKKGSPQSRDSGFDGRFISTTDDNAECASFTGQLLAGTSWLFGREELEGTLDYLFVDEAGQVALADAVAMSTAARNLVLLGDPQQLSHVTQGVHPGGAGESVLTHLLRGAQTVDPARGLFLERTWRMHPDVCRFVSDTFYGGRLTSHDGCARQSVDSPGLSGAGLRFLPVEHGGNGQRSTEEAEAVAGRIASLLRGGILTTFDGERRPIEPGDILVVAAYNMQVRCLRERLPAGVEVGTVDKFQGREGAVVFFSLASSSGEDVPRGLEFLFSPNRLNVAISRARCLAVIAASPRLLEARCRTVEQMTRVNLLCRFAEAAQAG